MEDASSTVTVAPVDVVSVKPDADTLATVPTAPPDAGPDRALDPPPPAAGPPPGAPCPAVAEAAADGGAAVAEVDAAQPAESPITAHAATAATIHRFLLVDSNRGTRGRRVCSASVTEPEPSDDDDDDGGGGGGGAAPAPPDPPATGGPAGAIGTGWGVVGS
ncbi:hypothetical protein GCM10009609_12610 [Pseudonocardia aurantiaca]